MKTTKKTEMYQRITNHGEDLKKVFNLPDEINSIKLCKSLLRLENKAHYATTCLCNSNTLHLLELNQYTGYDVEQATEEEQDKFFDSILKSLSKLIGVDNMDKVFINFDPRGYALKIKPEYSQNIYRDWGSNGILAPDLTN